ncbi:MAG TPA: hemerythrin family protein [Firmicutes bacterium]|nr:hemerythrin family protein [Bacillota bacterium]
MLIKWTPQYAVGVPEIDQQHQELFGKVNDLLEACQRGEGKQEIGNVLSFLEEYVKIHFGTEEKAMLDNAYPEYEQHRAQHQKFVENFLELKAKFEAEGAGIWLVAHTNRVVVDWLIKHIMMTDTKLGSFLKSKQGN